MVVPTLQAAPEKAQLSVMVEVRIAVGVIGQVVPTPPGVGPWITIAVFGQGMDIGDEMV
jgi:hypothetical protein